jgi:hypothetical protein
MRQLEREARTGARLGAIPTGAAILGLAALGTALLATRSGPLVRRRTSPAPTGAAVRAARRMNQASGVLAASVLLDSGLEHYRGSFHNKAMFAPLVTSALSLAASGHGVADQRPEAHLARDSVYAAAAATGGAGFGFHAYNIGKRPGGYSWLNLFYAAPIGAPWALTLSGLLGFVAERVRDNEPSTRTTIFGLSAGRVVAAVSAAGLLGTVGEAGLLHFRGAYHNPAMWAPVTLPPVAAAFLAAAAVRPRKGPRTVARWWLWATAALGFAGAGFHAYGVSRNMGGWRNWSQNVIDGPPLPAPPSFSALALAALAALRLSDQDA